MNVIAVLRRAVRGNYLRVGRPLKSLLASRIWYSHHYWILIAEMPMQPKQKAELSMTAMQV
jgi:hypothetical protein